MMKKKINRAGDKDGDEKKLSTMSRKKGAAWGIHG